MKICLVNSNISQKGSDGDMQIVNFQRGFLSLAAFLEKNGYAVNVVDLGWLYKQGKLEINADFHRNAAKHIIKQGINLIGFNTRCDTYPNVVNLARKCKELNPNATIIFGGPQASFTDEETLKKLPFVDIVVRGEGEYTLLELANALNANKPLTNIQGITYRENGRVIRNIDREHIKDLDSLPLPAYHLIDKYIRSDDKLLFKYFCAYLETGRGCPYRCTFCGSTLMDRNHNRLRSPQEIIKEIILLKNKYHFNYFIFGHDHFLANKKMVKRICRSIVAKKLDIKWTCSSRVDAIGMLDEKLLETMSKAGCVGIFFGVESGSQRIQKIIRKNINVSLVPEVIQECQKHGIYARAAFIMGFPEETKEDMNATLELALKCRQIKKCEPHIRLLGPMAGTDIFARNKDRLVFTGFRSDMSGGPLVNLKSNMDLAKKYPSLFSVFYVVKPRHVPTTLPNEAVTTFVKLLYTYPMSTYLGIKELKITPLDLLEELKKWAKKKGSGSSKKSSIIKNLESKKYFPLFLKYLYKRNKVSFDFLKPITAAEEGKCEKYIRQSKLLHRYIREKSAFKSNTILRKMYETMHFDNAARIREAA